MPSGTGQAAQGRVLPPSAVQALQQAKTITRPKDTGMLFDCTYSKTCFPLLPHLLCYITLYKNKTKQNKINYLSSWISSCSCYQFDCHTCQPTGQRPQKLYCSFAASHGEEPGILISNFHLRVTLILEIGC